MKRPSMKLIFSFVAVLFLFLSAGSVWAVDKKHEIQVTGGLFFVNGDAATGTAQLDLAYSYMWRPKWQIGVRGLASY